MTYSSTTDMLIGDVQTDETKKQKHVDLASKEVDEKLGFKYPVPIAQSAVSHPAWLLICRIANFYASGRFLLETDQSGEENGVHAYGMYLIQQADDAIKSILSNEINLLPDAGDGSTAPAPRNMIVANVDPYSQVEAFYGFAGARHWNGQWYGPDAIGR